MTFDGPHSFTFSTSGYSVSKDENEGIPISKEVCEQIALETNAMFPSSFPIKIQAFTVYPQDGSCKLFLNSEIEKSTKIPLNSSKAETYIFEEPETKKSSAMPNWRTILCFGAVFLVTSSFFVTNYRKVKK